MSESASREEEMVRAAIQRVLDGETDAFREVVTRFRDRAYSLSLSILKDPERAREAAQRGMIRVYTRLGSFRMDASFRTWFYRIVLNETYQLLREERRAGVNADPRETDETDHSFDVTGSGMESAVAFQDEKDREDYRRFYIRRAFLKLPEKESVTLRLFYLEEMSVRQLSETTGWSESHVKVLLHRGRSRMKVMLTHEFGLKEEDLL